MSFYVQGRIVTLSLNLIAECTTRFSRDHKQAPDGNIVKYKYRSRHDTLIKYISCDGGKFAGGSGDSLAMAYINR